MVHPIRHIIWDLDGTLIDSAPEILFHLTRAIAGAGITEEQKVGELRIGPTLDKVIGGAYCGVTDEQLQKATQLYRTTYDNSGFLHTYPFAGIEALLDQFDGVMHHIVTNKPSFATSGVLAKLGWMDRFASVRSPYVVDGATVNKARLFGELMDQYNINSNTAIGVGDMATDAVAAKEHKILSIGVTWGTGRRAELTSECDLVLDRVEELHQWIKNHTQ